MKKYRVWHGEQRRSEMYEIVEARNGNEAKQKVKDMFPGHKISACWLIERTKAKEIDCTKAEKLWT